MIAWALLAGALAAYWLFLEGRLAERFGAGHGRAAGYRFWMIKAWALFALPTFLSLLLLGAGEALFRLPPSFVVAAHALDLAPPSTFRDWRLAGLLAGGLAGGAIVGAAVAWWRKRRGRRQWMIGDVGWVLPTSAGDLGWAALLAVTAGITEELFFRLLLPLLIGIVTGSALAGFALSVLLFAAAHRYQRWPGVAGAFLTGLLFTSLFLGTGSMALAIAVHAAIDLNSLVLRPLVLGLAPGRPAGMRRRR